MRTDWREEGERLAYTKWPCCTFAATLIPTMASVQDRYNANHRSWWAAANIWEGQDRFSNIAAYATVVSEVMGKETPYALLEPVSGTVGWHRMAPHLPREEWLVCQGWRSNGTGHTFFLQPGGLDGALLMDSTTRHGVRVRRVDIRDYLKQYDDGLAILELWNARPHH